MSYLFKNIGNLDKAVLSIEKEKVNVRYGFNGVGKSTIVKSLKYIYGDEETKTSLENILLSYRTGLLKELPEGIKDVYDSLEVYDSNYFGKMFKSVDLLNNTYELLIHDEKYDKLIEPINKKINEIKNYLQQSNVLELFNVLNQLGEKKLICKNSKGKIIKGKTFLYEYAEKGVKITSDIPADLVDYKEFIDGDFRSDWNKWLSTAEEKWFEGSNRCPFCGNYYSGNLVDRINSIKNLKNKAEYTNYDREQNFVSKIASFIEPPNSDAILKINKLDRKVDEKDVQPLADGVVFLNCELRKTRFFLNLDASKLAKFKEEGKYYSFLKEIEKQKFNQNFVLYNHEDVVKTNIVSEINNKIDELIKDLETLIGSVSALNNRIKSTIKDNEELINGFLTISGMPYRVNIQQQGDTLFQTLFSYVGRKDVINNQTSFLSFGEANALALLLFCLETKTKKNPLIVLDDPVSSFDNNKKYAIFDYIFNNKNKKRLLWKRTCLLFTHDFDTIVLFANCHPLKSQNLADFAYMELRNYELYEKSFTYEDITNTVSIYKNIASNQLRPKISRIVAARHYYEIVLGKGCDGYHITSSLLHRRPSPTKDIEGTILYSPTEQRDIEEQIKDIIGSDYSYESFLNEIDNIDRMKRLYKDSKSNKFDKICIARCLFSSYKKSSIEDAVIWNFLSEVYHIEKDTIHSIGDFEIFDVPNYIIEMCDSRIDSI